MSVSGSELDTVYGYSWRASRLGLHRKGAARSAGGNQWRSFYYSCRQCLPRGDFAANLHVHGAHVPVDSATAIAMPSANSMIEAGGGAGIDGPPLDVQPATLPNR